MKTSDFDFYLPEELIAQTPLERRDASRLLTLDKHTGATEHHHFYELPQFLRPGDCLVLNNSRVLPARLIGHRPTGGAFGRGENRTGVDRMGRKCNDVYGEEKVYYYPGAIVRVRRPILTEEERARRMKIIEKAAADLLMAAYRKK